MDIKVTSFTNPFSFFCVTDNFSVEDNIFEDTNDLSNVSLKSIMSDLSHGQYILVMCKNKWHRGIVRMETQFLIWLVDIGIFIRPNDKTVYIDLPLEYRKYPTKVFEASIHGVVPIDKNLSEDCQIQNKSTTTWNQGSIERMQELLKTATKTSFLPIAILSTKFNDIVIGDLILELPGLGNVNVIDLLEKWPVFLENNQEGFIRDLPHFYNNSRRRHRASQLKPQFQSYDLPIITLETASKEYPKVADTSKKIKDLFKIRNYTQDDIDGSTITQTTTMLHEDDDIFKITPAELEKFSKRHIVLNGRTYNVLNILVNKARDLRMCEQYKDHDLKGIGRACSYKGSLERD